MTKRAPFAWAVVAGFALLVSSGEAAASVTYPEALRKELELDAIVGPAPGCRLCHQDDVGGLKTATKPLGRALRSAGAAGANVPSLLAALDRLEADRTDSDNDGNPDVDELRAGTDPNVAMDMDGTVIPMEEIPLPQTGCALVGSPQGAPSTLWLLALVLCARRLSAGPASRARAICRRAR